MAKNFSNLAEPVDRFRFCQIAKKMALKSVGVDLNYVGRPLDQGLTLECGGWPHGRPIDRGRSPRMWGSTSAKKKTHFHGFWSVLFDILSSNILKSTSKH